MKEIMIEIDFNSDEAIYMQLRNQIIICLLYTSTTSAIRYESTYMVYNHLFYYCSGSISL